jgi:hypothetical protein
MLLAGIPPSVPFLINSCLSAWTLILLTTFYRRFHSNCTCGSSSVSCSIVSKLVHSHRDSLLPPRGRSLKFSCLDPDLYTRPSDYEGTLLTGLGSQGVRIAIKAQSIGNSLSSHMLDQFFLYCIQTLPYQYVEASIILCPKIALFWKKSRLTSSCRFSETEVQLCSMQCQAMRWRQDCVCIRKLCCLTVFHRIR